MKSKKVRILGVGMRLRTKSDVAEPFECIVGDFFHDEDGHKAFSVTVTKNRGGQWPEIGEVVRFQVRGWWKYLEMVRAGWKKKA